MPKSRIDREALTKALENMGIRECQVALRPEDDVKNIAIANKVAQVKQKDGKEGEGGDDGNPVVSGEPTPLPSTSVASAAPSVARPAAAAGKVPEADKVPDEPLAAAIAPVAQAAMMTAVQPHAVAPPSMNQEAQAAGPLVEQKPRYIRGKRGNPENKMKICFCCGADSKHSPAGCAMYKEMSVRTRIALAEAEQRCINCFWPHPVERCPLAGCKACKGAKHHKILCPILVDAEKVRARMMANVANQPAQQPAIPQGQHPIAIPEWPRQNAPAQQKAALIDLCCSIRAQ